MDKYKISIFLLFLILACTKKEESNKLLSLLQPDSTGVRFVNTLTETEKFNQIQYLYFNNGAGVAAGDINNDGLADLYFTSSQTSNKLYLNKGNLKFEDISSTAGVEGSGDWKTGVTMADVNGDGLLDIYVCQVGKYKVLNGKNQLFINQGDLTFRDQAHEYGLDFCGFSTQAAFFDYDLDGDLDMYLLNHSVHTSRSYGPVSLRFDHDSLAGDRLYRNDEAEGRRFFTNVTSEAGIYNSQIGYGLGVNISDINNDGWPDIFISNDFHEDDYLYINNCNGTFTNRFHESIQHTSRSSMGNDVADFNNDGLLDIMVLDMIPEEQKIRKQSGGEDEDDVYQIKLEFGYGFQFVRNTLQLNLGDGLFSEIGRLAGVYSTDWSWSPLFCDLDNDGFKDLFITNGIYRRSNDLDYVHFLSDNEFFEAEHNKSTPDSVLYKKMPLYPYYNYIYHNNRDLTFTNKAKEWGITTKSFSNGSAYADLDNDGDLELITNNINEPASIYRNNASAGGENHFLAVRLKGKGQNTHAIGARIIVFNNGGKQVSEYFPTRGFMSASAGDIQFGLGAAEKVDSVVIRWPDLTEQVFRDVPANSVLSADMNKSERPFRKEGQASERLLAKAAAPGLDYRHIEDQFSNFKHEILVPNNTFSEGPAITVADFNNDGRQDLFAGSAREQPSVIFLQQEDGSFRKSLTYAFIRDLYTENIDAAAFDADGDGDQDLYVVRGGGEVSAGNALLNDILLINNGKGGLSDSLRTPLPATANNGSCVAECDFDNDGDIDLFVGSRSVPGAYGLSPAQMLLENDGKGNFTDVTTNRMKDHVKAGMVTDACWIDFDNDNDRDLVLAGEWMNITVLENDKGKFSDASKKAGLKNTSGWWSCIKAFDIDHDGDEDLIAGNHGLNTIFRASPGEPLKMYVNDFDKNGTLDQVISSWYEGKIYPVASFDQLKNQITGFAEKFPHYSDFGGNTVKEIFGWKALYGSKKLEAGIFESCIFLNDGNGSFLMKSLPNIAQSSPVRDILARDINNDGMEDLVLVGNDYTVKPHYGRQDASYGWCLINKGNNEFVPLMPTESGLVVKGDARKILTIKIGNREYLVAGVNNSDLQLFEIL